MVTVTASILVRSAAEMDIYCSSLIKLIFSVAMQKNITAVIISTAKSLLYSRFH